MDIENVRQVPFIFLFFLITQVQGFAKILNKKQTHFVLHSFKINLSRRTTGKNYPMAQIWMVTRKNLMHKPLK